ncbi:MAG: MaoC family dehydratase [Planctomycetaceae bacterium]
MSSTPAPIEAIRSYYGNEPKMSDWFTVEQEAINRFGIATADSDWLHTDPERAAKDSPYGGTIAFGFWTISMLTYFSRQTFGEDYPPGALYGLNYGFDKLRLLAPVRVGKRIRNEGKLTGIEDRGGNRYLVKTENTIHIEGEEKPAMVAEWLFLLVYPNQ